MSEPQGYRDSQLTLNLTRCENMAGQSRRELVERIKELEEENEELQSQVDEIADIIAPADEDDDQGED